MVCICTWRGGNGEGSTDVSRPIGRMRDDEGRGNAAYMHKLLDHFPTYGFNYTNDTHLYYYYFPELLARINMIWKNPILLF